MLEIDVEDVTLHTRNKAGNKGTYVVQYAYLHTYDRDGKPKRYPEQIIVFPKRNANGEPVAYPKGRYILAPYSVIVDRGYPSLGFVELVPAQK